LYVLTLLKRKILKKFVRFAHDVLYLYLAKF